MRERLQVIVNVREPVDSLALLDQVLARGISNDRVLVQLRAKTLTDRAVFELAVAVVAACRRAGARCIIDDRVDIALAAGADGVHVGDTDLPVAEARRMLGSSAIVGATARTVEAARLRQLEGATYIGCGPVFPTITKTGLPDALGIDYVSALARSTSIPVFAIGGITLQSVGRLTKGGCHGVAVVNAIAASKDPGPETRRFLDALASKEVMTCPQS
jgi:thiamine-phosphate pyrophosphorylase